MVPILPFFKTILLYTTPSVLQNNSLLAVLTGKNLKLQHFEQLMQGNPKKIIQKHNSKKYNAIKLQVKSIYQTNLK